MVAKSTKKIIKEFTTVKNVKLFENATTSTSVRKDTQKNAKDLQIEIIVDLNMTVLSAIMIL